MSADADKPAADDGRPRFVAEALARMAQGERFEDEVVRAACREGAVAFGRRHGLRPGMPSAVKVLWIAVVLAAAVTVAAAVWRVPLLWYLLTAR